MKKKALICIIALFFALPCFGAFSDVSRYHWAYPAVQDAYKNGLISAEKKFNGKALVNKYQLAVILERTLEQLGMTRELESMPLLNFYSDIPTGHYAYKAVEDLVKLGMLNVEPDTPFNGSQKLSRSLFYIYYAAFIEKALNEQLALAPGRRGYADVAQNEACYQYLQKLIAAGLLDGAGLFGGSKPVDRYQMVTFAVRSLYFLKENQTVKKLVSIPYPDVPDDNFAAPAIAELAETGILHPLPGQDFNGDKLINRYLMTDFISKIIEAIVMGDKGALREAPFSLSYKDVPVTNFAYPAIQKLIDIDVLTAGNRQELFNGDRRINRYQLVYFVFSAIEQVLEGVTAFEEAPGYEGFPDVPSNNFAYPAVQKLIALNVLEGGAEEQFEGKEFVDRYELCDFTVNLIKAVVLKLREERKEMAAPPADFGFLTSLNTILSASQTANGNAPGEDIYNLSASQSIAFSVNRQVSSFFLGYASLTASYDFGQTTAISPYIDQAYVVANNLERSLVLQGGRSSLYEGYTPFGNTLFVDTASDMIIVDSLSAPLALKVAGGKFWYLGDIKQDSSFGIVSISPRLPEYLSWLEILGGGSLITDLPDPDFASLLSTSVSQGYLGLKIYLPEGIELTAEKAILTFSNPDALWPLGVTTVDDTQAEQYTITYVAQNYGVTFSLGYQKLGEDYYLSSLANPSALGPERGTESVLIKTRVNPAPSFVLGLDIATVNMLGDNINNKIGFNSSLAIFESGYWNLDVARIIDNTDAGQDQMNITSSFQLSF
ncbi:MAG: S-layer homology domain-containing protein [Candidatus Margulisbacteria bacterium]|nr:S-layer homology domain-containing protein [Candidatus Margulisiibacteriota bacterium]